MPLSKKKGCLIDKHAFQKKVQLQQQIETFHRESQDCTLYREMMKETKLEAQSLSNHNLTQWIPTK